MKKIFYIFLFLFSISAQSKDEIFSLINNDKIDVLRDLIKKNVDIETKDDQNNSLLMLAIQNKQYSIIEMLLQEGADIEAFNSSIETPLFLTLKNDEFEILNLLIRYKVNLTKVNIKSETPLIYAIKNNKSFDIIKLLLANTPDLKHIDIKGNDILYYVIKNNNLELLKLFFTPDLKNKINYNNIKYSIDKIINLDKNIINFINLKKKEFNFTFEISSKNQLYPYKQNDKMGFFKYENDKMIKITDAIYNSDINLYPIKNKDLLKDTFNNFISYLNSSSNYLILIKDNKYGIINKKDFTVKLNFKYDYLKEIGNDNYIFKSFDNYGIINIDQQIMTKPQFYFMDSIYNKTVILKKDKDSKEQFIIITDNNKLLPYKDIIKKNTKQDHPLLEDTLIVKKDNKIGIVDDNGNVKISLNYIVLFILKNFIVAKNDKGYWGLINYQNKNIIDFIYDKITVSSNAGGLIKFQKNNKYIVMRIKNINLNKINKINLTKTLTKNYSNNNSYKGDSLILENSYEDNIDMKQTNNFLTKKDNKFYKDNNIILESEINYDKIEDFKHKDITRAIIENKTYYINKEGKQIIETI